MKAPRWAVNAANHFSFPADDYMHFGTVTVNIEETHKRLVRLQLAAYRRGVRDAIDASAKIGYGASGAGVPRYRKRVREIMRTERH